MTKKDKNVALLCMSVIFVFATLMQLFCQIDFSFASTTKTYYLTKEFEK